MRARDKFKYGSLGAIVAVVATAVLLTTGWGQAAAATVTQVFVTNQGAAQAVPVQQQGTANVKVTNGSLPTSARPAGSTPWAFSMTVIQGWQPLFVPPTGKKTLAVTSLTVANGVNSGDQQFYLTTDTSGTTCPNQTYSLQDIVSVLNDDTIHQDFPQPMVFGPGGSNWAVCVESTGGIAYVTAVGYYY